jgi:hypothetical protein
MSSKVHNNIENVKIYLENTYNVTVLTIVMQLRFRIGLIGCIKKKSVLRTFLTLLGTKNQDRGLFVP